MDCLNPLLDIVVVYTKGKTDDDLRKTIESLDYPDLNITVYTTKDLEKVTEICKNSVSSKVAHLKVTSFKRTTVADIKNQAIEKSTKEYITFLTAGDTVDYIDPDIDVSYKNTVYYGYLSSELYGLSSIPVSDVVEKHESVPLSVKGLIINLELLRLNNIKFAENTDSSFLLHLYSIVHYVSCGSQVSMDISDNESHNPVEMLEDSLNEWSKDLYSIKSKVVGHITRLASLALLEKGRKSIGDLYRYIFKEYVEKTLD